MIGIFKGLLTTLSTAMRRPVTIQYPDEKHLLPVRERSFPILLWDFEHDEPFCTGCNICVRNCPVDCMTATMIDNSKYHSGESSHKKIVEKFWIDYARCMRCNICVEVCPFEAIAMANNWTGHEHAGYDRRDLHLDIEDLLAESKSGRLPNPFFPYDDIAALDKELAGEAPPAPSALGARPQARLAALERVAAGQPAGLQGPPPPDAKPALARKGATATTAAPGTTAAAAPRGDLNSPQKIRARRMRAERAIKEAEAAGQPPPAEAVAVIEAGGRVGEAAEEAAPAAAAGAPDGAPRGDPNSDQKMRARRMRAEKAAKEAEAAGQPVPAEVQAMLASGGRVGADNQPAANGDTAAAPAAARASQAAPAPAPAAGGQGDPNSPEKQRARRMRAERTARAAGEERGISGGDLEALVKRAGEGGMGGANAEQAVATALAELEAGTLSAAGQAQ